jgi:NAD(P)-dependent dehydrogenase (short-subunit alcohol dehydrogenase family)
MGLSAEAEEKIEIKVVSFTDKWHSKPYPSISPTRPELNATGRNVIITGGGSGIGTAIATAFAQAGAASISIIGRNVERLEEAAKEIAKAAKSEHEPCRSRIITEAGDISCQDDIEGAVQRIYDEVGEIHVFVANAGYLPTIHDVQGFDIDAFRRGLDINVMGAFHSIQAFLPRAAKERATLINVSSAVAHVQPMYGMFGYATSKIAVAKMYEYVAAEHSNIHVVSFHPGMVDTQMGRDSGRPGLDDRMYPPKCTLI